MTPLRNQAGPSRSRDTRDEHLSLERFDYLPSDRSPALLSLSVRLPFELPAAARPVLILERESVEQLFSPRLASLSHEPSGESGDSLWRGVFAVPLPLVDHPQTTFAVRFLDELLLDLPVPADRRASGRPGPGRGGVNRTWPYAIRRGALLLLVTFQLCVLPGFSAGALADGSVTTPVSAEPAPEATPEPAEEAPAKAEEGGEEASPPPVVPPEAPQETTPQAPPESEPKPPSEPAPKTSGPTAKGPAPAPVPSPTAVGTSQPATSAALAADSIAGAQSAQAQPPAPKGAKPRVRPRATDGGAQGEKPSSAGKQTGKPGKAAKPGDPATGDPVPGGYPPVPAFEGLPLGLTSIEANEPPAYLVPIYKQAARRYDVPWRVLAAINQIETDYGQNLSVSSAGAVGWMQFMPATWQQWGVDADHDGYANPYSPQDAIFAAARYLQASGAAHDLAGAIFAYNHADWYVAEVLLRARMLSDKASFARVEQGYALPLEATYMQQLGRTDDGVDIETPPDGALVYSITPGVVSAVASDPAGFGPNYPVIEATSGSLAGQHIYYGHVAQALVQAGQRVAAGQPIAIVGHTGDAASLGHGHIEIGFSDAGGAPLNQHGAEAWTPAGSVMRAFLVGLSASFGVPTS
jgi:murein DD-endopeptidase MepM/ murein hydrolase activator NlpD